MPTLHLIRHGQTNWNVERRIQGQTDSVLTETGLSQAQTVAEELKNIPFKAAYSSSSIRARDTAHAILKHHPLELELRDDMREIFLGNWEGRLYQDVSVEDSINHQNFAKYPAKFNLNGAESFYQVQDRAMSVVNTLIQKHDEEDILLVSHGIWIKCILAKFENRSMEAFWNPPAMGNCCHSIIEFKDNKAKIVQYAGLTQWD